MHSHPDVLRSPSRTARALGRSRRQLCLAAIPALLAASGVHAAAFDPSIPASIPKYQSPLLIPLQMPPSISPGCSSLGAGCPTANYNIANRQFKAQVLPVAAGSPALLTTVWGYGRAEDPLHPDANGAQLPGAASSFSYPGFTVENTAGVASSVRWINELVSIDPATKKPYPSGDPRRTFLPPLFAVDPTLDWANPGQVPCAATGRPGTDCKPDARLVPFRLDAAGQRVALPYTGPVPMVVHVHGADDNAQSDGYPSAWWLPDAANLGAYTFAGAVSRGLHYDQYDHTNTMPGSQFSLYENTQPPTTLWYHDHSLGISRNTVYAGLAGLWLIRGNYTDPATKALVASDTAAGVLPGSASVSGRPTHPSLSYGAVKGCDANLDAACRALVREIPLLLQDRSFNSDGSFHYPASRDDANAYAATWNMNTQALAYAPASDVAPIINPETFGSALLVNGRTWPTLTVAAEPYRLRLVAGGDARSYNLSLWTIPAALIAQYGGAANVPNAAIMQTVAKGGGTELPFYVVGSDQGFLPKAVSVRSGHRQAVVPGTGKDPAEVACVAQKFNAKGVQTQAPTYAEDPLCERALLMTPGERVDAVVKFNGLAAGTVLRLINNGPDVPFNGFPLAGAPAVGTTDQLMHFVVGAMAKGGASQDILSVALPAEAGLAAAGAKVRQVALVENPSGQVCVSLDLNGAVASVVKVLPSVTGAATMASACAAYGGVPFGPAMTMLGPVINGMPAPQAWADPITQVMTQGQTEQWELYNFTQDAHPMHLHDTRFRVLSRQPLVPSASNPLLAAQPLALTGKSRAAEPGEGGYKDVVVANPREVTRLLARFNRSGVYVWHCHILEHEDNEMMLPMCIRPPGAAAGTGVCVNPATDGLGPLRSVPVAPGL